MTNQYMTQMVRQIRAGEIAAGRAVAKVSTGEGLMILLAAGTPSALRLLAKRGADLTYAWHRIDANARAFVLQMWGEDAI